VRFINELQQRPPRDRVGVDVMQEERLRQRFGNGSEVLHDQIDVVQAPPFDEAAIAAEMGGDRQTTCQPTSKAVRKDRGHDLRGAARILGVQQGSEHDP
jgi:hypothetical protein